MTVPLTSRSATSTRRSTRSTAASCWRRCSSSSAGAGLGYTMAERIADPVSRLTRATRRIARRRLRRARRRHVVGRAARGWSRTSTRWRRSCSGSAAELERTQPPRGVGRDGAPGGARHQEPADADPAQRRAPAARPRRPRRAARPGAASECVETILSAGARCCGRSRRSSRTSPRRPRCSRASVRGRRSAARHRRRRTARGLADGLSIEVRPTPAAAAGARSTARWSPRSLTNIIENALHAMPSGGRADDRAPRLRGRLRGDARSRTPAAGMDPEALGAGVRALLLDQGAGHRAWACRSPSATSS